MPVNRWVKVALEKPIQKTHPGWKESQFDVAKMICTANEKTCNVQNTISSLRKAGNSLFNKNVFTDLDVAPVYENTPSSKNAHADEIEDSAINSDHAANKPL